MTQPTGIKVLFIAHHFPPMGGPGTNRSVQFVKYLHELGYEITVLTITEEEVESGWYPVDRSMAHKLPEGIEVVRVPVKRWEKLKGISLKLRFYRVLWFFLFPMFWEGSAGWLKTTKGKMLELVRQKGIQVVYSSSGPYTPMRMAAWIKRKTGIKWVGDMRDPYTDAYAYRWPSKLHWHFCRWMEKRIFRQADKLVVNTPEVKKLYIKRGLLPENKIEVITNGF